MIGYYNINWATQWEGEPWTPVSDGECCEPARDE